MTADCPGAVRRLRAHAVDTLRIGLPLSGASVAQLAMLATDTILLGGVGPEALAAGGLGGNLAFNVILILQGVVGAAGVFVAQLLGAGTLRGDPVDGTAAHGEVGAIIWAGALIALLLCAPGIVALGEIERVLLLLGEAPELARDAGAFTSVLRWAVPGAMIGTGLLRAVLPAIGAGWIILPVTLGAAVVNLGIGYGLIHGRAGLPQLGLLGPAVATVAVNTLMAVALAAASWAAPARRDWLRWSRPRRSGVLAILRLGLPIGAIYAVEAGLFSAIALLVGLLGPDALAAQQVALSVISLAFMLPLGISQAANVRVGFRVGAADLAGARNAGTVAIALGAGAECACAAASWLIPGPIVSLYVEPGETARLAVALLQVAALFQVADGVQCVAAGALRGLGDARVPFVLASIGYWVIGFPLAWALALPAGWGVRGAWWGLAAGLTVTSTLLTLRFLARTRAS